MEGASFPERAGRRPGVHPSTGVGAGRARVFAGLRGARDYIHLIMTNETNLGGRFTFPGTNLSVHRMGYGAMQLAGPHVFGPPRDPDGAVAVLREAVAAGVNHIDTSDFYGPHVTNQIIREALHPYSSNLVIVTKLGAVRRS